MFILNSHGASGKSQSERPAPSSAWSSPTKMPCMRSWRGVCTAGSLGVSGSCARSAAEGRVQRGEAGGGTVLVEQLLGGGAARRRLDHRREAVEHLRDRIHVVG